VLIYFQEVLKAKKETGSINTSGIWL